MNGELVVVGAGPAGLAAALTAARAGVEVTLVDSAAHPGGQIWRQPGSGVRADAPALLAEVLAEHCITWCPRTSVVHAGHDGSRSRLLVRDVDGGVRTLSARALVLAVGAAELSLPFPGWSLPGVVTPGAAQAMLKADGVPIGRRVVVAGTGPFLWPVAAGLVQAGVQVAALVEAQPWSGVARHAGPLALVPELGAQAAGYARVLARAHVPVLTGRTVVEARGELEVHSVLLSDGRSFTVDALCVGWGFVPSVELARSLGCAERPHPARGHAAVEVDADQATSVPGVYAAGELTGIGGAAVAQLEGTHAGAAAARYLGASTSAGRASVRRLRRVRAAAAALDRAYPPPSDWIGRLADDTVVCRCEEVPWRAVRAAVDDGADTARAVKGLTRCGMGWCQGRVCGPAVQAAVSARTGRAPADVGDLAGRPFAVPLTVGELAGLHDGGQAGG